MSKENYILIYYFILNSFEYELTMHVLVRENV